MQQLGELDLAMDLNSKLDLESWNLDLTVELERYLKIETELFGPFGLQHAKGAGAEPPSG